MGRGNRLLVAATLIFGFVMGAGVVAVAVLPASARVASAQDVPTAIPTPTALPDSVYAELDTRDQVMINLYDRVNPSVVHIASRQNVPNFFYGTVPQEGTGVGFSV